MFNVFIFFVKPHEKNEDSFFFQKRCTKKDNVYDLRHEIHGSLGNYYFAFYQNDLFYENDMRLIEHINELCLKVRKFMVNKERDNFNTEFIVAVHPPRKEGQQTVSEDHIKWQKEMKQLVQKLQILNAQIVYYSSKDSENPFLKKDDKYNYDYVKLFDESEEDSVIEQEFEKFLNLLKARAKGEEIEFFKLKKKLDDLFHAFFVKAIACKGMLECLEKGKEDDARNYYLKSLGRENFKTILAQLKTSDEAIGLEDINRYRKDIYDALVGKLGELTPDSYEGLSSDNLKSNVNKLGCFLDWYIGLKKTMVNILREAEKGGN